MLHSRDCMNRTEAHVSAHEPKKEKHEGGRVGDTPKKKVRAEVVNKIDEGAERNFKLQCKVDAMQKEARMRIHTHAAHAARVHVREHSHTPIQQGMQCGNG